MTCQTRGSDKDLSQKLGDPSLAVPAPPPSRFGSPDLKEITTTVIALVIVGITAWMILQSYFHSGSQPPPGNGGTAASFDKDGFERGKDILAFALGLFGTVTGYYFGRVPAEKQADAARHSADVAKQGQAAAENRTQQVRRDVKSRIQEDHEQHCAGPTGGAHRCRPGVSAKPRQHHRPADLVARRTLGRELSPASWRFGPGRGPARP